MDTCIIRAAQVAPSERQLAWQCMEFYAFIHFGVNTFTDREWGTGNEDPFVFHPEAFDPDQWARACKSAGMKGLILTCKHHDGFCLWPSAYTAHSVRSSRWREGAGDVVRDVSEACRKAGLAFGVYLSPWDRHEHTYGDSPAYNRYFVNQLTELLTGYGPVFCVWLDGACGEGPNGQKQVYDWEEYYATIRRLQPDAVISVCGPDVRWCGNEAGHCRPSEWSVVPRHLKDNEKIEDRSQKADDGAFARRIGSGDEDLGSREMIKNAELIWYPAEVNTSIRPGWFYHPHEDGKVKPLKELLGVYYGSVGGNASFLLNIPPDRRGLIHEADTKRLAELGRAIKNAFATDVAAGASVTASETLDGAHAPHNVLDGDRESFWRPGEGTERAEIVIQFKQPAAFNKIVIMEHIQSGQRIEEFALDCQTGGTWAEIYRGTVVGYKKICHVGQTTADAVRLRILGSRWFPTIARIIVYSGTDE